MGRHGKGRSPVDLVAVDSTALPALRRLDLPPETRQALRLPEVDLQAAWRLWLYQVEVRRRTGRGRLFLIRHRGEDIGLAGWDVAPLADTELRLAEIHYFVAEAWRRQGLGTWAVEALVNLTFETTSVAFVRAVVHRDNEASLRLLERCGFEPMKPGDPGFVDSPGFPSCCLRKGPKRNRGRSAAP